MIIKKYNVNTIEEGQALIQEELGPHAVILASRQIKYKGWKAFFFSNRAEIVAAVDPIKFSALQTFSPAAEESQHDESTAAFETNLKLLKEALAPQVFADFPEQKFCPEFSEGDLLQNLTKKGVDPGLTAALLDQLKEQRLFTQEAFFRAIREAMGRYLPATGPLCLQPDCPTVAAVVGMAGVGKTSTLLKLAHEYSNAEKKVAIVYVEPASRVAEKIEASRGILNGISYSHVYSKETLREAIGFYEDCDLILIDTASCSPCRPSSIEELQEIISCVPDLKTHLIVSIHTREDVILSCVNAFRPLGLQSLMVTKLDEEAEKGALLNLCKTTSLPLSYLTYGQEIRCLTIVDPQNIIDELLSDNTAIECGTQ